MESQIEKWKYLLDMDQYLMDIIMDILLNISINIFNGNILVKDIFFNKKYFNDIRKIINN